MEAEWLETVSHVVFPLLPVLLLALFLVLMMRSIRP